MLHCNGRLKLTECCIKSVYTRAVGAEQVDVMLFVRLDETRLNGCLDGVMTSSPWQPAPPPSSSSSAHGLTYGRDEAGLDMRKVWRILYTTDTYWFNCKIYCYVKFGHLGLWNPWTDRVEIWHDWLSPRRDNPCQFWWKSVGWGDWAITPLVPLYFVLFY